MLLFTREERALLLVVYTCYIGDTSSLALIAM